MASPIKFWRNSKKQYKYLGKRGKIISFTRIKAAPAGFGKYAPYWAGIIELDNGDRVAGQIVVSNTKRQTSNAKENTRVVGILRRMRDVGEEGVVEYGVKWKIVKSSKSKVQNYSIKFKV